MLKINLSVKKAILLASLILVAVLILQLTIAQAGMSSINLNSPASFPVDI
jgi:hypothetical protein